MTSDFLVLECPRCGGRLRSSEEPNVFRCRNCDFDVMHRETRVVTKITVAARKDESDDIELFRVRLKHLRAQLEELRSEKGSGCGCFVLYFVVALAWEILIGFGFLSGLVWTSVVIAGVVAGVAFAVAHGKATPEERTLEEQIRALEKVIARKEGW